MIALLCKIALLVMLAANLAIAVMSHGRLIGYMVTDYKEGDPPQVLAGAWKRFNSKTAIVSTLMYGALLWGAGVFDGGVP